jgi:mRNA interferase MazF
LTRKIFQIKTGQLIVCPITKTSRPYPTRVPLDSKTKTQGFVICDHIKTIDAKARNPIFIEPISYETLNNVLDVVHSEIEKE